MFIRAEKPSEFALIHDLIKVAFQTAPIADGDEQNFAARLRASQNYIPTLALVAEENAIIIGHIMFTRVWIKSGQGDLRPAFLLAPLAVALARRSQGVGAALVRAGLERAAAMGAAAGAGLVFVLGDKNYYKRFGFVSAMNHSLSCNLDIEERLLPNVMVAELWPDALQGVSGVVELPG